MWIRSVLLLLPFLSLAWSDLAEKAYKPIVLWHGMGDSATNPDSMGRVVNLLQELLPGTFVHSIQVGKNRDEDHEAGFFGEVNKQIDLVCEQLAGIPELAEGFNAVGFSQGGLFLRYKGVAGHFCWGIGHVNLSQKKYRAYVERCNRPAVHRLITFGSPHGGVSDIPNCMNPSDLTCRLMRSMVRYGAYSNYVQHRVVQAQYFRDPKNIQGYLEHNIFLPDINNELKDAKNHTYSHNLATLDAFVMVKFADDVMVKPGETAWFWTYSEDGALVPLVNQTLYTEDWLGLRKLGGRLKFLVSPGQHMEISDEYFENQIVWPYLASSIISSDGSISISGSGTTTPPQRVYQQQK